MSEFHFCLHLNAGMHLYKVIDSDYIDTMIFFFATFIKALGVSPTVTFLFVSMMLLKRRMSNLVHHLSVRLRFTATFVLYK